MLILNVVKHFTQVRVPSMKSMSNPEQLEEERRLLYVALTRAKDQLYLIKPHLEAGYQYSGFSGFSFSTLSRFLEQGSLLEKYADRWVLVENQSQGDIEQDDRDNQDTRDNDRGPVYRF